MTNQSGHSDGNLPARSSDDTTMVLIGYVLYLAACLGIWLGPIIAVVLAYVQQDKAPDWVKTHFQFQIRTFWIALLGSIVSGVLIFAFYLGALLYLLLMIWLIIRCVKGIVWLQADEAVPNPESWMFGTR